MGIGQLCLCEWEGIACGVYDADIGETEHRHNKHKIENTWRVLPKTTTVFNRQMSIYYYLKWFSWGLWKWENDVAMTSPAKFLNGNPHVIPHDNLFFLSIRDGYEGDTIMCGWLR